MRQPYFTTRHLTLISALAAAGGITSTYINMLGDAFQAALGFAGSTQWAAGLHVLWLVLASRLTNRIGAATAAGLLKGLVELFTGNTHGVLVLLIDLAAGVIVDIVFALARNRRGWLVSALAGGMASASNVFLFQLFSFLPADRLVWQGLLLLGAVAFLSGVIFAGILAHALLAGLAKAGLARVENAERLPTKRVIAFIFFTALIIFSAVGVYIWTRSSSQGGVQVDGAVSAPYTYSGVGFERVAGSGALNGVQRTFEGVPVKAILEKAQPLGQGSLALLTASDGYAFMVSMDEVATNPNLVVSETRTGNQQVFNVLGATSSKAWVRGLARITLVVAARLPLSGAVQNPQDFVPQEWQSEMDSFLITFSDGQTKTQGVPLALLIKAMQPRAEAVDVVFRASDAEQVIPLAQALADDELRIFTVIKDDLVRFALARSSGAVLLDALTAIEVR